MIRQIMLGDIQRFFAVLSGLGLLATAVLAILAVSFGSEYGHPNLILVVQSLAWLSGFCTAGSGVAWAYVGIVRWLVQAAGQEEDMEMPPRQTMFGDLRRFIGSLFGLALLVTVVLWVLYMTSGEGEPGEATAVGRLLLLSAFFTMGTGITWFVVGMAQWGVRAAAEEWQEGPR